MNKNGQAEFLFIQLLVVLLVVFFSTGNVFALSDDEKRSIGIEATKIYRAARGVIAKSQGLINDASKGDKGLSADVVISKAKRNYRFTVGDKSTLRGQTQQAMVDAIKEVMNNAQSTINKKGKGFKGFLPAIFAKQVGDSFNKIMKGKAHIKLTAPKSYVRNRANRPDKWENNVIENMFKKLGYEKDKVFVENAKLKGKPAFRLILPEYYKQACLKCHGEPKGEIDITGGNKEGGKLGDLGGAISFALFN